MSAVLYGALLAFASDGNAATFAAPHVTAPSGVPLSNEPAAAHIALLLPAKSTVFAAAAAAVRSGFMAAAETKGGAALPIREYPVSDDAEDVVASCRAAQQSGARVVVGPLTRSAVTALAGAPVPVPTLALNVPEGDVALPPNLYTLSLHVETEAQQVAQLALREGRRSAITIVGDTPLLHRIHRAFVAAFTSGGGRHVAAFAFSADPADLGRLKAAAASGEADMAFLALDLRSARLARPYLDPLFLYATSQVNPGDAGPLVKYDLAGVRFLDMPWLLEPDHAAVMIYPRDNYGGALDLKRLYALGIDAFRVARTLLSGTAGVPIDGVTGRITLGPGQRFMRRLTVAQFRDGKLITADSARR